jgi:hypothetical protein
MRLNWIPVLVMTLKAPTLFTPTDSNYV